MSDSQIVLITGASGGIGQACAEHLGQRGYRVYGTSRRASPEPTPSGSFQTIQMDVDDDASVKRGVDLIVKREGRLDVAVNNAGVALVGPIEDMTLDEARAHLETNFLGVLRVCQAVLPIMREQGGGYIINMSSMSGRAGLPYQGMYSAGKFAVEGLTEALRFEVRHMGIKVALVEPGDIRTQDCRTKILRTPAYAPYYTQAVQVYEADEARGYPAEKIGALIERIICTPQPRLRYPVGSALQRAELFLKGLAPYSLYEWAMSRIYEV